MSTVLSLHISVALLLLSVTTVLAADDEKDNTDFLLNVFSDIGPILALFGEQFARQFLSETFTWEDHVIFACIPLGIMTAISGAIRVQGGGLFKAVIGRARENHAAAEIEYMSSTSTEVCELYNGEGIVRTMGKPYIGQIIVFPNQFANRSQSGQKGDFCGIHTLETATKEGIMKYQEYRVDSRPRLFKCFESSTTPTTVVQKSSKRETQQQDDPETGEPRAEHTDTWDSHDSSHRSSKNGSNIEKKNPWLTLKSPNLQLNIPCEDVSEQKHRFHLVLAAIVALVLQIALLAIAISTVYLISGFEPEPWGLPCYLGGSVLLFLGMLACSVAIEKRTRELIWFIADQDPASEKEHKEFHLLWVQRSQRVSEQDFGSYIIDGGTRHHIMTSSRYEDLQGLEKPRAPTDEPTNEKKLTANTSSDQQDGSVQGSKFSFLPLLPLIAVLFGGIGFTVQFIGLRGLPWPCAVSQLGAMIIMAIIRALIRRRLTNPLRNYPLLQKHELDYLAIQLVENNGNIFDDQSEHNLHSGKRWDPRAMIESIRNRISGDKNDQKYQSWTEVLAWKVDTASDVTFGPKQPSDAQPPDTDVELIFKPRQTTAGGEIHPDPTNTHGSKPAHTGKGQRAILVRKRLGDLCKWPNSTSKSALALTLSIERFMKEFFPGRLPNNDSDQMTWKIPFSRSHQLSQKTSPNCSGQKPITWVKLDITRDPKSKGWGVDNGQVEAILSLWMAHWTAHRADHLEAKKHEGNKKLQSTDWRRAGDGSHVEYCRRIGENRNGVLKRDISWWVNNAVEGLQREQTNEINGSNDNTSSGSNEDRFIFGLSGYFQTSGSSAVSISSRMSGHSRISGTSRCMPGPSEKPEFLVQHSTADLATVMAQHLFTCFIWNIGSMLPKNFLNRADININEFVKVESSRLFDLPSSIKAKSGRKLSHRQLTKFVNYAEKQGLGTPDDILLCIIPTFSFFDCLPNNVVLDYDQLIPKPFGSFKEDEQKKTCNDYIGLLDCIQKNNGVDQDEYLSSAVVVNIMEFVYLTALHIDKAKLCGTTKKTHPEEFIKLLQILSEHYSSVLRKLSPFYEWQRRRETFKALFSDFQVGTNVDDVWPTGWSEREQDKAAFMYKIGFTNRHQRVIELKPPHRRLNLQTLLVGVTNGSERDIFGWTPLHYAAARPELEFKPERTIPRMGPEDKRLEIAVNDNLRSNRWVDKFRRSPVHVAAAAGNINLLNILLPYLDDEAKLAICKGGVDEMSPLHLAAQGNHMNCNINADTENPRQGDSEGNCNKCIVTLLEHTPQAQYDTDAWKQSPIQTTVTKQCYQCTLSLLQSRNFHFSPETPDEFKNPLFFYLKKDNKQHTLIGRQLLLKHYQKFDIRKNGGDNILHYAIKFLDDIDLHALLESLKHSLPSDQLPLKVDVFNKQGQTPLHLAVSSNKYLLVQRLIEAGASPSVQDANHISPMILACQRGYELSAYYLLSGTSSSNWSSDWFLLNIIQQLSNAMTSIDVFDHQRQTPLQSAVVANRKAVCLTLLRKKASIKLVDIKRLSALNRIVQSGPESESKFRARWESQIREITTKNATEQDEDGDTALHKAVYHGDYDTLDWLMQNKADLRIENVSGRTAFIEACRQDNCHKFIRRIVDDLNSGIPDSKDSQTPQLETDTGTGQLLPINDWSRLADGTRLDINQGDSMFDQSPLAWACEGGHEKVVEILLTAKTIAIIQKATKCDNYTPLHFALFNKNPAIVQLLLDHPEGHVIWTERDENGFTVIQFAIMNADSDCLHRLLMHPTVQPSELSYDDPGAILRVCSGFNIQPSNWDWILSRIGFDETVGTPFLDEDKWTLADIAGKYGHPNLESHLRNKIDNNIKKPPPLRPSVFVSDYSGLSFDHTSIPDQGWTINMDVTFSGTFSNHFYFRTKEAIPPEDPRFYFEVKILRLPKNRIFMMGFCGTEILEGRAPGWDPGSWAYHTEDGGLYEGHGKPVVTDTSYIFKKGDVIGCGVDFNTGKGYRTRNRTLLKSGHAFGNDWLKTGKLYPCVGFRDDGDGDKLEVQINLLGSGRQTFQSDLPPSG
ncbi:hypothetical protein FPSE5266_11354 [Fusarium pseudograminearum]|nr:hypothetical protein FPSE5266_11354 [Fusarium pseudograminearum]